MTQTSKPVMDLVAELINMSEMKVDSKVKDLKVVSDAVQKLKQSIRTNPLHGAMQAVFLDQKEKIGLSTRMIKDEERDENEERLNNMLMAEGIVGPSINFSQPVGINGADQNEYHQQLLKLRREYEGDINLCQQHRIGCCETVKNVLHSHGECRPITQTAIEKMYVITSKKFDKISQLLKQNTCEELIQLKKRYHDNRRSRKNFSKKSTEILNEWFLANVTDPYPSEEMKQALALQCNISVSQVSNWFGNKRGRFKKTAVKNNEERQEARNNRPAIPPGFIPNAFPGMMNPYNMMIPGQPLPIGVPFNFNMYNPEMIAQYQQSLQNTNPPSSRT